MKVKQVKTTKYWSKLILIASFIAAISISPISNKETLASDLVAALKTTSNLNLVVEKEALKAYRKKLNIFISRKNRYLSAFEKEHLIDSILTQSKLLNLPKHFKIRGKTIDKVALVTAFIKVESTFKRKAVSRSNAQGYMQLKPSTVVWMDKKMGYQPGYKRLFDAKTNITKGVQYLNHLSGFMRSTRFTVLAYNAGPGSVQRGYWHNSYWTHIQQNYLEFQAIQLPRTIQKIQSAPHRNDYSSPKETGNYILATK